MSQAKNDARLNFRLSPEIKKTIEVAAAQLGQTVSDFAVSTLVQTARKVIQDRDVTVLSRRDADLFASMLDDRTAKPSKGLAQAAKRYRKRIG